MNNHNSETQNLVVQYKFPDVSEVFIASILNAEEQCKQSGTRSKGFEHGVAAPSRMTALD
jgi:hypothetical protein